MDAIDIALSRAWQAFLERVEEDPAELQRRLVRARRVVARPVRAWCLCVRAADTRIDEWQLSWTADDAAERGLAHDVHLTQWDLKDLTAPVDLRDPPGERVSVVARALGHDKATIGYWIKKRVFEVEHYDARVFNLPVGGDIASIWSRQVLDPNAFLGRPPHPMWGSMWEDLAKGVPKEWRCTVRRVWPETLSPVRSWHWVCPGLKLGLGSGLEGAGCEGGCGRVVKKLYLPLPCWTLADFRGERERLGIPAPPWEDLRQQPLACRHCWRILQLTMTDSGGWNHFVSHITGGLLHGAEVKRPGAVAPGRRNQYSPRSRDPAVSARRDEIRRRVMSGASNDEIARAMGISAQVVRRDILKMCRDLGVGGRRDLVPRGGWLPPEIEACALPRGLSARAERVARWLLAGWSMSEMARELDRSRATVGIVAREVYEAAGVGGRDELRAKLLGVGDGARAGAGAGEREAGESARGSMRLAS